MIVRARDICCASVGILLSAPIVILSAIAVRIESGGPVVFRQTRVGLQGRTFSIHKLRTMRSVGGGPLVSAMTDTRISRVGRVLRRMKIDELPQFVDVLRGDMSLVGPRPEVPEFVELWDSRSREIILSVRPGLTDPASVLFRNEGDLLAESTCPERTYVERILPWKVRMYVDYVSNRSVTGDFRIMLETLWVVAFPPRRISEELC